MDTVSLQTKRPARDEPSSTGASAAHGRSMAKRACPDSGADAATWSGGDEDSHSDASVESEWSGGEEDAESECSTDDEDAKSESCSEESECPSSDEDAQSEASVETDLSAITELDWSDMESEIGVPYLQIGDIFQNLPYLTKNSPLSVLIRKKADVGSYFMSTWQVLIT